MTDYAAQLHDKTARLAQMLAPFGAPELTVFPSPERHYRMRAEFRIWHDNGRISYAMFRPGEKASTQSLIRLEQFPAAAQSINDLMPKLIAAAADRPLLRDRWYQCEFLATLSGQMLLTLIYHKKLDEAWQAAATQLADELGVFIIGRSKGQKVVLTQDFVTETLQVHGQTFRYRQYEGSFTQPNAHICQHMLEWACTQAGQQTERDLLELYCGNGNFTLPLAQQFRRVLATEISKTSVRAAEWNIAANHNRNIAIARLSAEEFAQAHNGSRSFQRLRDAGISLTDYDFSTLFIDPPRAGVDENTLKLAARFDRIIYISCNPDTLCANLHTLTQSHRIAAAALFDQFPFTPHIESGVLLVKKAA